MKITVIGCSTSWTDRPTSSYCINGKILVDCGDGTYKNYKNANVDFDSINNIFITHLHSDHTASLLSFIASFVSYPSNKHLCIYGPQGIKKYLRHLLAIALPDKENENLEDYFDIVEITDYSKKIKANDLTVSTYPFMHGNLQDIAYIFDDGNVKVGFSGDLHYQEGIDKFISNFDYGFLECCSMKSSKAHLGYDHFIELQNQFPDKKIYAIHCVDDVYFNEKSLGITCAKHNTTYEFNK